MYSIQGHGNMIADGVRSDAYLRALQASVRPGSVVVDIGTGTGFFAILACRLGARRVIAIESSDMIEVARRIAQANGCADRIDFIHASSTAVDCPERVDVVVSDLHGVLPFFQGHLVAMMDARERFLAPRGTMIPARESLWVACVEAPELHSPVTTPWSDNKYGLDMHAARALAANQWRRAVVQRDQLVTVPAGCGTLDYASIASPDFDSTVELEAAREAESHGFCLWFDSTLAPGVEFSNAPGAPGLIYGNAFFPWPEAVPLARGDRIELRLRARLMRGEYLWTWETRVMRGTTQVASFRQSDFFGEPLAAGKVRRHSSTHVAKLGEAGRIDALVLGLMQQDLALGEIAHRLVAAFPGRFARWQDALTRVAELSQRYGEAE
ncbi:MAG: class I SAM-dependent methyltransferase [Burkholderiales bacterium]|nr:class I SAM-dependent methyltransferase [Burkholderiales bacterium]